KIGQGGAGGRVNPGRFRFKTRRIGRITEQGVADMGEVDADLVGAAGFELAGEQARDWPAVQPFITLDRLAMVDCFAAAGAHRHLLAGFGMTGDWGIDRAFRAVWGTPDEREVSAPQ